MVVDNFGYQCQTRVTTSKSRFNSRKLTFINSYVFIRIFVVWLCVYFYVSHRQSQMNLLAFHFTKLMYVNSESMRRLQNFTQSGYRSNSFFKTGTESNLAGFESDQNFLLTNLPKIGSDASDNFINLSYDIGKVTGLHNALADSVRVLTALMMKKGYKDYGAEGELRKYAHYLEDSGKISKNDLLILRRKEKDFILREEPKYVRDFDSFSADRLYNSAKDPKTRLALSEYIKNFNEYVYFAERINMYGDSGTLGRVFLLLQRIDESYNEINSKIINAISRRNEILDVALAVILLILFFASIGLNRDIKKREADLEKTSKELGHRMGELIQFNYIVSHNLRAPVANILGMAEIISIPETTPEDREQCIAYISQASFKLDSILRDLNTILETRSALHEKKEWVNIGSVVDGVQQTLSKQIADSGTEITLNSPPGTPLEIYTIKSYLESILYNLVGNAIKYRSPDLPSRVSITIACTDQEISIAVADNGIGIDLKKFEKQLYGLYNRFNTHVEGKGLGLFMTKIQIETLGGTIRVDSTPNQGSTFTVVLPLTSSTSPAA